MRVALLNAVCGTGSTGKIVIDLYQTLLDEGHSCKIFYGLGKKQDNPDFIKFNSKIGYYTHNLLGKITDGCGRYSIIPTINLINKLKKYQPDIIHIHNIHGYYINYKLLFKYIKKIDIKVVWTLHDCWAFTGHCSYFSNENCNKWQNICHNCPLLSQYPKSYFFDNSKQNFKSKRKYFTSLKDLTIVTPSDWLASEVKKSFLSKYQIKVINNGINLDVFKPTKCELDIINNLNKKIILGVANVWNTEKGFDDFMELSKMISDEYVIVMVGLSENQIKNLPSNIIGITRTNNQTELASIYSASHVFLNLTYQDNYPTVNLEAQACGLPMITYNTDGSPEAVFKDYGYVVEKGNVSDVYESILKISKSDKLVSKAKVFDCKNAYKKYVKLYEEILKNN